jgi:hypothetical protein
MRRHLGFFPGLGELVPVAVAAAAMYLLLELVRQLPWPLLVVIGAAVYAAVLWTISPRTRRMAAGLRG